VAVVAHTAYADESYVREMVAAGARGYVLKEVAGAAPCAPPTCWPATVARSSGCCCRPAGRGRHRRRQRVQAATPDEVTVSIGLASWDFRESAANLVRRADEALYHAKTGGRDRYVTASVPA
jgi:GGDEF domain-containing protein